MTDKSELVIGGTKVTVSRADKVLFPDDGITKGELVEHYRRVAPLMLPWLRDRPLAFNRYPDGLSGESFFQQAAPNHAPDWVRRVTMPKEGGHLERLICEDEPTLVFLANQAAVTLHSWLSRIDRPERPDQVLFDLDPPQHDFAEACWAACRLRDLLCELDLASLIKTTGGRGLHVMVRLARTHEFDSVRGFALAVAELLAAREPKRLTIEPRKASRQGRLYLDVTRNAYGQHAGAPYSVRARPGAPVATPLDWCELEDRGLRPDSFTLRTIERRLRDDAWDEMPAPYRSLGPAFDRLQSLRAEAGL